MTTVAVCLLLYLPVIAQEHRSLISLCMDPINRPEFLKTTISYQISRHWSAGGSIRIGIPELRTSSDEEESHEEEFSPEEISSKGKGTQNAAITFEYWPDIPYRGPFISFGARCSFEGTVEGIIRMGYIMNIYRQISVMVCYEKSIGRKLTDNEGIGLGLCINF